MGLEVRGPDFLLLQKSKDALHFCCRGKLLACKQGRLFYVYTCLTVMSGVFSVVLLAVLMFERTRQGGAFEEETDGKGGDSRTADLWHLAHTSPGSQRRLLTPWAPRPDADGFARCHEQLSCLKQAFRIAHQKLLRGTARALWRVARALATASTRQAAAAGARWMLSALLLCPPPLLRIKPHSRKRVT